MEWPKDRQGVGMHPFHRQPHSEALRALWAGGSDRPARRQRSQKSRRAVAKDSGVDFGKLAAGFFAPPADVDQGAADRDGAALHGRGGEPHDDGPGAQEAEGPPGTAQAAGPLPVEGNGSKKADKNDPRADRVAAGK